MPVQLPAYISPVNEIGVEALQDEVRTQAHAYMAHREVEFWDDAKARYPALLAVELTRMESQIDSGGASDLSWLPHGAYDKLMANARRKTQRVLFHKP
jgi:hypothetical protein